MAIALFRHNQDAYVPVVQMLQETGKADVICPTETRKFFTAFRLCENYPKKTIRRFSPSAYIFRHDWKNHFDSAEHYYRQHST